MTRKISGNTLAVTDDDDNTILSITVKPSDDTILLIVTGSITHDATPEFEDELMSVLTSGRSVIVDFSSLVSTFQSDTPLPVASLRLLLLKSYGNSFQAYGQEKSEK